MRPSRTTSDIPGSAAAPEPRRQARRWSVPARELPSRVRSRRPSTGSSAGTCGQGRDDLAHRVGRLGNQGLRDRVSKPLSLL